MSLACAFVSLLAVFGLSAMTVVPGTGAERLRGLVIIMAGAFAVAWFSLAFWVQARQRMAAPSLPPQWLRRLLVCASVVYLLGIFLLVIG
jgi:hypothetical protein